jgi:hypothetical protein
VALWRSTVHRRPPRRDPDRREVKEAGPNSYQPTLCLALRIQEGNRHWNAAHAEDELPDRATALAAPLQAFPSWYLRMECAACGREMRARFDRIFRRRTGFATLDRLLARLHANKAELLTVLERPDIPLHTNGSERDIRCQVIKRKISGGTHSDTGRDCRDAFLGLMHTATKLGIAFWDYLGARLGIQPDTPVPYLPNLIRCRGQPA